MKRALLLAILLLLPCSSYAANCDSATCDVYVDPDVVGGDADGTSWANAFASLSAAEADADGDLTDNGGSITTIHCKSSSGGDDSTVVDFDGWTTSSDYYVIIQVDEADRHSGVYDASKYEMKSTSTWTYMFSVNAEYTRIIGLQIDLDTKDTLHGILVSESNIRIDSCIIKNGHSGAYCVYVSDTGLNQIFNSIIYDCANAGIYIQDWDEFDVFNCTIEGCGDGIHRAGSNGNLSDIINCAVFQNTDDFDDANAKLDIDFCASDDGDGGDSESLDTTDDYADEFEDVAGNDYSLPVGSICIGNGTDNPGAGLYSDDIDGTSRGSTWDIGAFEYEAAAGGDAAQVIRVNIF